MAFFLGTIFSSSSSSIMSLIILFEEFLQELYSFINIFIGGGTLNLGTISSCVSAARGNWCHRSTRLHSIISYDEV